jgi:CheY-like chemotaxis protein
MDDEDIVRMVLSRVLEKLGFAVDATRNGQEALEVYTRTVASGVSYEAAVVDLTVIGGMGGVELARELHHRNPSLRIVVSSGHTDSDAMANYREQGFADVIRKPYTIDEVKKVMASLAAPGSRVSPA